MSYNVTPQLPDNGLTVVELFAGGGLMGVGVKSAGYNIIWANDFEKTACIAYARNIGNHIIHGDITKIRPDEIPNADVFMGGSPCQDYSVAGDGNGENGERGKLVWSYLNIIEVKQPKAFVFENVKGLVQKKHYATFDKLISKFNEIGYNVSWQVINSWDYGVAQKRERVFVVGIRKDLDFYYVFPKPSEEDYRSTSIRSVIGDMPNPPDGVNSHIEKPLTEAVYRHAKGYNIGYNPSMDSPASTIRTKGEDVFYPNHSRKDYWIPPNPDFVYAYDQSNRLNHSMDSPSPTITAHHNSGKPMHPLYAPRRFTVRECLRLQSVPDWYTLPDEMSLAPKYRIVGNGVASRVAYLLTASLAEQLNNV